MKRLVRSTCIVFYCIAVVLCATLWIRSYVGNGESYSAWSAQPTYGYTLAGASLKGELRVLVSIHLYLDGREPRGDNSGAEHSMTGAGVYNRGLTEFGIFATSDYASPGDKTFLQRMGLEVITEFDNAVTIRSPYWLIMTMLSIPGLIIAYRWNRRRNRPANLCPQCGYDLRATPDSDGPLLARCPECGTARDAMVKPKQPKHEEEAERDADSL